MTWKSLRCCQCVYQDAVVSAAKRTSRTHNAGLRPALADGGSNRSLAHAGRKRQFRLFVLGRLLSHY